MKRFILFIIVALPVTAVLSMGAGFYYAGNARRVPVAQPITAQPAPVIVPVIVPTSTPAAREASPRRLRIQLQFCFDSLQDAVRTSSAQDVNGVRICADNLREMNAPAAYRADALALADQFAGFADEYESGVRDVDAAKIEAAGNRIIPISKTIRRMLDTLPE